MNLKSLTYSILFSLMLLFLLGFISIKRIQEITSFELEINMKNNGKYEIEYEMHGQRYDAEYKVPGSPKVYGEEAKAMIEPLLNRIGITPNIDDHKLLARVLSVFTINENNINDFKLKIKFRDGTKIKANN